MSALPGSIGGRADDVRPPKGVPADGARVPEGLADLTRRIDRFVGAAAGEARAIADGMRRSLGMDRFEQAIGALRNRWRRDGSVNAAELERALRLRAYRHGLERTIEEWPRHTVGPPSIRV